ncbi:PD-(D/E)XK motif protein [Clostridium algidicarnis]|uniref:PD-(D/E)XK motif protein n=1 Tax=Clostridium algidicarnis TaxID=37659 RepID=A0ABS6C274_9CLOT|nr:PD-(D/E)XK motif protein [Clostridium algidicarnis]MBB6698359.1 PD-(D/E)XK motif protein [Clostridium algidicarnis]MBU3219584.1 PD-(D/E)XK motif protein [Clostridium algidicarnis]
MNVIIKEKFQLEKENNTFRRVDRNHHIDIFLGYNEKGFATMVIITEGNIQKIDSSRSIEVRMFNKNASEVTITFSLLDNDKETMFYKFCDDIIESSRKVSKENCIKFIVSRWDKWRSMFKRSTNELLSENQIIGLLGELIFLRNFMIPKFGYEMSIKAWMGPEKAHKDFEIGDTWYEVKTIRQGGLTVKISSVEQLASKIKGHLEVIILDITNEEVDNAISLNTYIDGIQQEITEFESYYLFAEKLRCIGYFDDEEYNNYKFKYITTKSYSVEGDFPRILEDELKPGIVKLSYDILIKDIDEYICGGE